MRVIDEDQGNISDGLEEELDVPVADILNFEQRLETFGDKGLWFELGLAARKNMAESGFFCLNETLRVKRTVMCVFCRKEFAGWKRDDDPWARHRDESEECAFAVLNKPESQLTIRQLIELELFAKLKIMEEQKDVMKAEVIKALFEVEQLVGKN